MNTGEALARYGDAVAVGSELCDALLNIASGQDFAERTRGLLQVTSSWSFEVAGQAVVITKRGLSFGDYENQHSLSASDGTQIVVVGEDIPGMDELFDTRAVPGLLKKLGVRNSHPDNFTALYNSNAPVGNSGLTLGTLLDWAVGLDAEEFGEALVKYEPATAYSSAAAAHFGDTVEGLGRFSVTAILRDSGVGRNSTSLSRSFTLQLLPERLVFDTEERASISSDLGVLSEEPSLSIRGSLFAARKLRPEAKKVSSATLPKAESIIGYTTDELDRIHRIGRGLLRYVAGYSTGYSHRFETSEPAIYPGEMFTRGYEAGRRLKQVKIR